MTLAPNKKVSRVELLRAEKDIPFTQKGNVIEFVIPGILDYEVAAMYSA